MARRRRKSSPANRAPPVIPDYVPEASRGYLTTAIVPPAPRRAMSLPVLISPRSVRSLMPIEDRRTWHPDPVRPARSLTKRAVRLGVHPLNALGAKRPSSPRAKRGYGVLPDLLRSARTVPFRVGFAGGSEALVCVRRHVRRAVMISKGIGSRKPRKWSTFSKIVCRRR